MPSIFLYVLADYNAGSMVGEWVDVSNCDRDELIDACERIKAKSKSENPEELAIADYEGFYGLTPALNDVLDVAQCLEEYGEAYAHYALDVGEDYATCDNFEEAYCGEHDSFLDYAQDLFDECYGYDIPEQIRFYIDYEKFARDLLCSNDYFTGNGESGKVHVFRSL
jgi:antirestriction protein